MARECQQGSTVLAWIENNLGSASLWRHWEDAYRLGWLPRRPCPVVLQVGIASRDAIVLETARSLADFLADRQYVVRIFDPFGGGKDWNGLPLLDVGTNVLKVAGVAARMPLAVPEFWFEPHFLVTIAGATPHAMARISAVLNAQADILRHLGNTEPTDVLLYEAHRLMAANLAVACGRFSGSHCWWAAGISDVAVEQVVARAAGLGVLELPSLRTLTRHERQDGVAELLGTLPILNGWAAPASRATLHTSWSRIKAAVHGLALDARTVRQKMPMAINTVRRLTRRMA